MSVTPLLKLLTQAGIDSRRKIADAIRQGKVEVNGNVVIDFRHLIDTEKDRVSIYNRSLDIRPRQLVYLLLNKPAGVLSTTRDERGRKTVLDVLPKRYRHMRLYPVGRLDKDTTGLLLLTNDGELTHKLTHPSFKCEKEYLVAIRSRLKRSDIYMLEKGITLEDGVTHSAVVREINTMPFNYSITIHEGRKRQVRRMFEHLGHRVTELRRIRIGNIRLGDLGDGKVCRLNEKEVRNLLT